MYFFCKIWKNAFVNKKYSFFMTNKFQNGKKISKWKKVLPVYTLSETKVKTTTKIDPPKNENIVGFSSSCITCYTKKAINGAHGILHFGLMKNILNKGDGCLFNE